MRLSCLLQSFRLYSGPVIFLTAVCLVLGGVFLSVGASMGGVFVAAGIAALVVFTMLGAKGGRMPCR